MSSSKQLILQAGQPAPERHKPTSSEHKPILRNGSKLRLNNFSFGSFLFGLRSSGRDSNVSVDAGGGSLDDSNPMLA